MSTSRQFNTPISLSSAALTATHNSNTIGNIFTTGGNVGINTTTPDSALHVAGSIPYIPLGDGVHMGLDPLNSSTIQLNAGGSTTGATVIDMGYSGVTYKSRIVHTNSTNILGFRVNGNTYDSLSISSTGNVGIGTTTPSSNLTISTNGAGPQVAMYPQSNGGETSMSFYNNNIASGNTTRWVVGHNVTVGIGNFGFWNSSFNAPVMALTSTGNIGIGTTNPTSTLDIVNSSPLITLRDSIGSNGKIYFGNSSHGVGRNASIGTLTYGNDVALWTNGAGASIGFATLLTERMRITDAGNVGINTTAPGHNLEILGDLGINKGIRLLRSGTLNYIQSGTSTGSASSADLRFTDIFANSTYMTIRTSGNVGIGTTAPISLLHVNGNITLPYGNYIGTNQTFPKLIEIAWQNSQDQVLFYTPGANNGTAKMCLQHNGNVGIGTTSPAYALDVNGTLEASNSNGLMLFASSGNVLIGSTTPTGSAFGNGNLYMYGANGSNNGIAINGVGNSTLQFWNSGTMKGAVALVATAGNWSPDSRVGDMVIRCASSQSMLFNSNGGSGVATMVISGGNVGIGTTSPAYALDVNVVTRTKQLVVGTNAPSIGGGAWLSYMTADLTNGQNPLALQAYVDGNYIVGFYNSAGTFRGTIQGVNASSVTYLTTSDRRRKTNIQDMDTMINKIKQLKPRTFDWIEDNQKDNGFIAQEVHQVFPQFRAGVQSYCDSCGLTYSELYDGNTCDCFDFENPLDKNGNPYYYGLDYGKLTPYLTKALQETIQIVEEQQSTIDRLVNFIQEKFPGEYN